MTEPGGPAWRQSIFFPFATTSRLARGAALDVRLEAPEYGTATYGDVPLVDAVATYDAESGTTSVFVVNRSLSDEAEVLVDVQCARRRLRTGRPAPCTTRTSTRRTPWTTASGSACARRRRRPIEDGRLRLVLPKVSWTAVELG